MMDRLGDRAGFRVHAHGFRHTFATVATKLGWNCERLRAAMSHEELVLQPLLAVGTSSKPSSVSTLRGTSRRFPPSRLEPTRRVHRNLGGGLLVRRRGFEPP